MLGCSRHATKTARIGWENTKASRWDLRLVKEIHTGSRNIAKCTIDAFCDATMLGPSCSRLASGRLGKVIVPGHGDRGQSAFFGRSCDEKTATHRKCEESSQQWSDLRSYLYISQQPRV